MNTPFRMRIRDLAGGKTIAEKSDDKPEVVANYIAAVWAWKFKRDTCEWIIQVYYKRQHSYGDHWRDLTSSERKLMESLIAKKKGLVVWGSSSES